jgi:hypothetical protein
MAATKASQYAMAAQLGVLEGIKAGLLQPTVAQAAAIAALTPTALPDATDDATVWALANDLKVKVNAIIAALKTA